ncbi:MAG: hypothetical protein GF398_06835 [Chitinivibrionales bacterium]|nr:hypothetical protein [Chitinivibrionales bacterium]
MNTETSSHPAEEALTHFALGLNNIELREHVDACSECHRYVQAIQEAKQKIKDLPDVHIPDDVRKKILAMPHKSRLETVFHLSLFFQQISKSPFLIVFAIVLLAVFLYIFLVFVL